MPYGKLEAESRKVYFNEMRKWKDMSASVDSTESTDGRREKRQEQKRKIDSKVSEKKKQNHGPPAHRPEGKERVGHQPNSTAIQHPDQHHNVGYQPDHTNHSYMHPNQYYQSQPSYHFGQMRNVPLGNSPIGPNPMGNASNMNYNGSGGHHISKISRNIIIILTVLLNILLSNYNRSASILQWGTTPWSSSSSSTTVNFFNRIHIETV